MTGSAVVLTHGLVLGREGTTITVTIPPAVASSQFTGSKRFFVKITPKAFVAVRTGTPYVPSQVCWNWGVAVKPISKGGVQVQRTARRDHNGVLREVNVKTQGTTSTVRVCNFDPIRNYWHVSELRGPCS